MMHSIKAATAVMTLSVLLARTAPAAERDVSGRFWAFGDSLSDTHRMHEYTNGRVPGPEHPTPRATDDGLVLAEQRSAFQRPNEILLSWLQLIRAALGLGRPRWNFRTRSRVSTRLGRARPTEEGPRERRGS